MKKLVCIVSAFMLAISTPMMASASTDSFYVELGDNSSIITSERLDSCFDFRKHRMSYSVEFIE